MAGRCHVWPGLNEFNHFHGCIAYINGRFVQPNVEGNYLFSVMGQETCESIVSCQKAGAEALFLLCSESHSGLLSVRVIFGIFIDMSVLWQCLACDSLHVCTVCIWRCEHASFCVEVFYAMLYIYALSLSLSLYIYI